MGTIEVFADVRCPFTHVGLRRLVERRHLLGRGDVQLRLRAWPLELVNAAPLDAELIGEEVSELRAQVAPDLFGGFDPSRFPATSMPALALAASGYEQDAALGEQVSLRLRDAVFEDGRDVANDEVLADIAASVGAPAVFARHHDAVVEDWEAGRRRGVIGSPHFFVGGSDFFCPSLDIARVDGALRISADPASFDRFLLACFAT